MKKLWTEGPPNLQARIRQWQAHHEQNAFGYPSAAETFIRCSEIAYAAGYDMDPPATPILSKVAELKAARAWSLLAELRLVHGAEKASEQRAVNRYQGLRKWAAEDSADELTEKARVAAAAHDRTAALERRTLDIIAEEERATHERRRAAATKRAEKELAQ